MALAPVGGGGTISVRPADLYAASDLLAGAQGTYDTAARTLLHELSGHQQLAGRGEGPDAFAAAYAKVAARFLAVWATSVVSVGGAAVGLTVTANNYRAADWHSDPARQGPPPSRALPRVIDHAPHYGTAADLTYRGTGQGSGSVIVRKLGAVPDWISGEIQDVIEQGLRLGKTYDITPSAAATKDEMREVAGHWTAAAHAADNAADTFSGIVDGITDDNNGEWRDAMRAFCQTIWGTTAWGGRREGLDWRTSAADTAVGRRPLIEVLGRTAAGVAKACDALVTAARQATDVSEDAALKAARAMLSDLMKSFENPVEDLLRLNPAGVYEITGQAVLSFRSHMDYDGVNRAVDTYNATAHGLAADLLSHLPALDEAALSAPTFNAEDARAEAFGARSLNDFRHEHPGNRPGDTRNGLYRIDLADDEGLDGAHTLDKHVGKTDGQLAQRLRDQQAPGSRPTADWPLGKPSIGGASTFVSADRAQELTQYTVDRKAADIKAWLGPPAPTPPDDKTSVEATAPNGEYSGYSVTKQPNPVNGGFKLDGMNAKALPVHRVRTVLKYDSRLDPPFVVLTSMPVE